MTCAHCQTLWAQLVEARAELREWAAQAAGRRRSEAEVQRLSHWRAVFRCSPQVAKALILLADAECRVVTKDALVQGTRGLPGVSTEDPFPKIADVMVAKARATLTRFALAEAIQTHWGLGWSLPASSRHIVLGMVGERA